MVRFIFGTSMTVDNRVVRNHTDGLFTILSSSYVPKNFTGVFRVDRTMTDRYKNPYYLVNPILEAEQGSAIDCLVHMLNMNNNVNGKFDLNRITYLFESINNVEDLLSKDLQIRIKNLADHLFDSGVIHYASGQRSVPVETIFGQPLQAIQNTIESILWTIVCSEKREDFQSLFIKKEEEKPIKFDDKFWDVSRVRPEYIEALNKTINGIDDEKIKQKKGEEVNV